MIKKYLLESRDVLTDREYIQSIVYREFNYVNEKDLEFIVHDAYDYVDILDSLKFPLRIYRVINIGKDISRLNYSNLGRHWTFEIETIPQLSYNLNGGSTVISVVVEESDVDWISTLNNGLAFTVYAFANEEYDKIENEITLKKNTQFHIDEIFIGNLKDDFYDIKFTPLRRFLDK